MREITHMMGAKLASAAVMAAVCSADLACGDTPIWGTAELIVEIGIESFRATGFAALGPEDFVVSDGDISMTVYRIVDNEPALLGNITDCDELLYRRVWNTDIPTLLLTSGNRVLSLDAATGTYSICSVGSNVQSLAVTPVGNISFENRPRRTGVLAKSPSVAPTPPWQQDSPTGPTSLVVRRPTCPLRMACGCAPTAKGIHVSRLCLRPMGRSSPRRS